jgi:hypothetical protein
LALLCVLGALALKNIYHGEHRGNLAEITSAFLCVLCGKILFSFIIKTPSFPPPVKFLYGFRVSAPLCPE